MRSKLIVLFLLSMILSSCSKPEQLSTDELQYVKITLSLTTMRAQTADSTLLNRRLDSTLRAFNTTKQQYQKQTESLAETPDRSEMIYRAINDSLSKPRK